MSNNQKQQLINEIVAILQGKIPSVRTGAGQNGKILVSKSALLAYFNEVGGVA